MELESINPFTEQKIASYEEYNIEDIEQIILDSNDAFYSWKKTSLDHKIEKLLKVSDILLDNLEEYAKLITLEMGKPLTQSVEEIKKCALVCKYYADHAYRMLEDQIIRTECSKSFVTYAPLGIILAIMPWNFPFWQVFRFAIPVLLIGNSVLLKHAANVTGCSLAMEKIFKDADFPENAFRSLIVDPKNMDAVIENKLIAGVTLTGSVVSGANVAAKAGKALKKTVLELGGSDPFIVLDDADIKKTVEICVQSRLFNAGQSCISPKRIIVLESVYKEFEENLIALLEGVTVGLDPMDPNTQIGPLAKKEFVDVLNIQVKNSIKMGAKCLFKGDNYTGKGYFYNPTILTNVNDGMPAYKDELFGPVFSLIKVKNEEEAINVANDTSFGLGASIFSKNIERALRIAREDIDAGSCFINTRVKSDPRLPFGGIKQSGYGRELGAVGLKEFCNIKTICAL